MDHRKSCVDVVVPQHPLPLLTDVDPIPCLSYAYNRYHNLRLAAVEARVHFLANFLEVCRLNHHGCPWSLRRVTNESRVGELTEGLHPDYQARACMCWCLLSLRPYVVFDHGVRSGAASAEQSRPLFCWVGKLGVACGVFLTFASVPISSPSVCPFVVWVIFIECLACVSVRFSVLLWCVWSPEVIFYHRTAVLLRNIAIIQA